MGKLISLSTMREIEVPRVEVGRLVHYTGDMANAPGYGAVIAIREGSFGLSYDVALSDGREWCATHLDRSRWEISDQCATDEQLAVLRAGVVAKKASDQAAKTSAKEEFARQVERLKAEYSYLEQGSDSAVAARNIRTELKRAFPGVKFSVRLKRYSGGESIDISWTDGPMSAQVDKIARKYQGGDFDGMTDCYNYRTTPWTEVFGDARYVFCNRDYSAKMVASVIRRVCAHLGGMESIPSVEDYQQGRLWQFKQSGGCDVQQEINLALSKHTYCLTKGA